MVVTDEQRKSFQDYIKKNNIDTTKLTNVDAKEFLDPGSIANKYNNTLKPVVDDINTPDGVVTTEQPKPIVVEQPKPTITPVVEQPKPTITPVVEQPKSTATKQPTINGIDTFKQGGSKLTDLENLVESRYNTVAQIKDNKLVADINGERFEWTIDNAGNPIKTSLGKVNVLDKSPEIKKQEVLSNLEKMLDAKVSEKEIMDFYKNNQTFGEDIKTSLRNYFKNNANLEFFTKYGNYTKEEIYNAYKEGKVIPGTEQFNLLPEQLRKDFLEYKTLKEKSSLGDSFSFEDLNKNQVSLNDIFKKLEGLFSKNIYKEFEEKMNSGEMKTRRDNLSSKAKAIQDLDNTIKGLEDDIRAKYPGASEGHIQAMVRRDSKLLFAKKDDLVNGYNAELSVYSDMKEDFKLGLDMAKYDDQMKRDNFKIALGIYENEKAKMTEKEKRDFEVEQNNLSQERDFEYKKKLINFQEEIDKNKGGEYLDDGVGNIQYVKNGVVLSTLSGLGKKIEEKVTDNYDQKFYQNDDGSYTAFNIDKRSGQISMQTYNVNGDLPNGYISMLGNGKITSYGGVHDGGKGLDIDGKIGQPVAVPMSGVIHKIDDQGNKGYGKFVEVLLNDGNIIRYSHLNKIFGKKGDKIQTGGIVAEIGNTGYTIPGKGGDGSHLDITTGKYDPKTNTMSVRSARETEDYLGNIFNESKKTLDKQAISIVSGLKGTEKEREIMKKNIVDTAINKGLSLLEAKKYLGYKSDDDTEFIKNKTKEYTDTSNRIKESLKQGQATLDLLNSANNPIIDVASVVGFLKTIDPTSVARESEVEAVRNTKGVIENIQTKIQSLKTGESLNNEQRDNLKSAIKIIVNSADEKYHMDVIDMVNNYKNRGLDYTVLIDDKEFQKAKRELTTYNLGGEKQTKYDIMRDINEDLNTTKYGSKERANLEKKYRDLLKKQGLNKVINF